MNPKTYRRIKNRIIQVKDDATLVEVTGVKGGEGGDLETRPLYCPFMEGRPCVAHHCTSWQEEIVVQGGRDVVVAVCQAGGMVLGMLGTAVPATGPKLITEN